MKHSRLSARAASHSTEFSEGELRNSGIPPAGKLGDAKKEAKALAIGLGILVLIVLAIIIDIQL